MSRTGFALAAAATLALLAAAACDRRPMRTDPRKYEGLDRRLDPFTYLEEGELVALGVGVEATRLREAESYIPLAVGMANKSRRPIRVDRESFILHDEAGRQYPLAPVSEIIRHYDRIPADRRLNGFLQLFTGRFPTYILARSGFYPVDRPIVTTDHVDLAPQTKFVDYLYFPRPQGGLVGHRFELHVRAGGLEEPVFVKFLVD